MDSRMCAGCTRSSLAAVNARSRESATPTTALAQILYVYYQLTPEMLSYIHGVKIEGDANDFCRAFQKNYGGLFEHF